MDVKPVEQDWSPAEHYKDRNVAEQYDRERFANLSGRLFNAVERRAIVAAFRRLLPPGAVIADVPCGTGRIAEALLEAGFRVVGVDVSAAMLAVAQRRLARFSDRFVTRVANVLALDGEGIGVHCDGALCCRVLMHYPQAEQIAFIGKVAGLTDGPVVFNHSLNSPYLQLRRRLKRLLRHRSPVSYPVTDRELTALVSGAGLRMIQRRRLAPLLSEALVATCLPRHDAADRLAIDPARIGRELADALGNGGGGEPVPLALVRPEINSILFRAAHPTAGDLAVKCVLTDERGDDGAQAQYEALVSLQTRYPARDGCRTLRPVLFLPERRAIVTEWVEGRPLADLLRDPATDREEAARLVARAGTWLHLLHSAEDLPAAPMRVGEILTAGLGPVIAVDVRWAAPGAFIGRVVALLLASGDTFSAVPVRRVVLHGDFKPDNVLFAKGETIGIDVAAKHRDNNVADVGYFLNSLRLLAWEPHGLRLLPWRDRLEEVFLIAYTAGSEPVSWPHLLWWRLYHLARLWIGRHDGRLSSPAVRLVQRTEMMRLMRALETEWRGGFR